MCFQLRSVQNSSNPTLSVRSGLNSVLQPAGETSITLMIIPGRVIWIDRQGMLLGVSTSDWWDWPSHFNAVTSWYWKVIVQISRQEAEKVWVKSTSYTQDFDHWCKRQSWKKIQKRENPLLISCFSSGRSTSVSLLWFLMETAECVNAEQWGLKVCWVQFSVSVFDSLKSNTWSQARNWCSETSHPGF